MKNFRSLKWFCLIMIFSSLFFCSNPQVFAGEPAEQATALAGSQLSETELAFLETQRIAEDEQREVESLAQWLLGEDIAGMTWFGYKTWRLIAGLLVIILVATLNVFIRYYMKRYQTQQDNKELGNRKSLIGLVLNSAQTSVCMIVWSFVLRILPLILFTSYYDILIRISSIVFSLAIALFIYRLVDVLEYYLKRYAERTDSLLDDMLVTVVRKSMRVFIVIFVILHIYRTYSGGKELTTLLAGLGIGGLAFALASQDTLKNLFGFFMILADRPFVVGERIDLCGHDGIVESVGFRSVRIRRLDGHLVSVPNSKAADEVIRNIQRRPNIRRIMNITITYDTPIEKIEKAIEIVRDILKDHEGMDPEMPPRVYFNELNADSLNIFAIYWYHPPEWWDYLEHAQKVNLELMRRFEAAGIEFAFPTQTLYLAGDPNRNLMIQNLNQGGGMPGAGS
ncbi:MAG: mechanosensitive ion channel family protein [Planctomycetes bacterium]|nr:mechanosensitive ion channel family protein [Planctomycetota bacterium]